MPNSINKSKSNGKWTPTKSIIAIVCTIVGGTGLYFTQYIWASARLSELNKNKLCTVEKNIDSLEEGLKSNEKEDRRISDSVIEMKGDIKNILRLVHELNRQYRNEQH